MPEKQVSSEGTSSAEMKKLIQEQTEALLDSATSPIAAAQDAVVEEPETEETETTEQAEGEEAQETKSEEGETTVEEPAVETPPKKETLHKLKVEGKEEEWPYEKVIAFAQQGRFLEKEKQRLNEEKRRLEEERSRTTVQPQVTDPAKAKEAFFTALAEDPFSTLGLAMQSMMQNTKQQEMQEKKAEREFQNSRKEADADTWEITKPIYEQYREEGIPREQAYLMAENELLRRALSTAKQKGLKEGQEKAKLRAKAEIPSQTGKAKVKGKTPSPEEFKKMTASEMRKHLPRAAPNSEW